MIRIYTLLVALTLLSITGAVAVSMQDTIPFDKSYRYCWTENEIGASPHEGYATASTPIVDSDNCIDIITYNYITGAPENVKLHLNKETQLYEVTGQLYPGDFFINNQGISITLEQIHDKNITFRLEKVDPKAHTDLCPECLRIRSNRFDDGIFFAYENDKFFEDVTGQRYAVTFLEYDAKTGKGKYNIDGELLPILEDGDTYVLRNGYAIKQFYTGRAPASFGSKNFAAIGFFKTPQLPEYLKCPMCEQQVRVYYAQPEKVNILTRLYDLRAKENGTQLAVIFGDKNYSLPIGVAQQIDKKLKIIAIEKTSTYATIGFITDVIPRNFDCSGPEQIDLGGRDKVELDYGADDELVREDVCLTPQTLAEYTCQEIPNGGSAEYITLTFATCDCVDGTCVSLPTCVGPECYSFAKDSQNRKPVATAQTQAVQQVLQKQPVTAAQEIAPVAAQNTPTEPETKMGLWQRMTGWLKRLIYG